MYKVLLIESKMDLLRPALLFVLLLLLTLDVKGAASGARRQYSRSELLQLNSVRSAGVSDITLQLPDLIL